MTLSDDGFRFLSLCASPPGSSAVAPRLPSALVSVPSPDAGSSAALVAIALPFVVAMTARSRRREGKPERLTFSALTRGGH